VVTLSKNWRDAELTDSDRVMLDYVEKLTLSPWDIVRDDVEKLRAAGYSDAAILDINQVTGYYAFVNRLADGLGVELEPFHEEKG
jgi:uncharacterized peroxidase-related enzyme